MNYIRRAIISISLFLAFAPAAANQSSIDQKARINNLFIIVMNGVRYNDALGEKNHLYIDNVWNKLRPLGTICTKFDNRELTFPIPSQMSLLTGVWHVFEDPLSETVRPAFPTLFEYWNSSKKSIVNPCYFASNQDKYKILTCSNHKNFGKAYAPVFDACSDSASTENAIYEKALPYIMEKHPSLVYLSLGSAGGGGTQADLLDSCKLPGEKDACGGGTLLNAYYESIILMDGIVFDLWDRIQQDATYKDRTAFLVLTDHGRHTDDFHGFGDKCKGCTQLFLLAIGPGIKKNFVSKRERSLIDVCRTVGDMFDIPTPGAKGDVMKELFE